MLSDFLSKNSGKKEIFGDGTSDNPGLLGQMIENPEYYGQNKKLVDRIYEEYVRFDETLSEDAKAIIQEKLLFLAGSPPAEGPKTEKPDGTGEKGTGFLAKFQNLGKILLWIGLAIVGLFGAIFAWGKIAASRKKGTSGIETISQPISISEASPAVTETSTDTTPDWLKSSESPFGSDDVLADEVHQASTEAHTPDWMDDHTTPPQQETKNHTEEIVPPPAPAPTAPMTIPGDVPDWLQDETTPMEQKPDTVPIAPVNTLPETEQITTNS